jgi:hypothetical protein
MSICQACINYNNCNIILKDQIIFCNNYAYVIKDNGFYIKKHPHHGHKEIIGTHYTGEVVEEQNDSKNV